MERQPEYDAAAVKLQAMVRGRQARKAAKLLQDRRDAGLDENTGKPMWKEGDARRKTVQIK